MMSRRLTPADSNHDPSGAYGANNAKAPTPTAAIKTTRTSHTTGLFDRAIHGSYPDTNAPTRAAPPAVTGPPCPTNTTEKSKPANRATEASASAIFGVN